MESKNRLSIQAMLLPLLIMAAFTNVNATTSPKHSNNHQGQSPLHPKAVEGANKKEKGHHEIGGSHDTEKMESKNKWFIGETKSNVLKIFDNGITLKRNKEASNVAEVVRAVNPFPFGPTALKLQYYAVALDEGEHGCISIGLADSDRWYGSRFKGQDLEEAWTKEFVYDNRFGSFENGRWTIRGYGPEFGNGQTIGCGVIQRAGNVYVFFTLDGELIGDGRLIHIPPSLELSALYPTIIIKGTGYKAVANFDADPAKFEEELDKLIAAGKIHEIDYPYVHGLKKHVKKN